MADTAGHVSPLRQFARAFWQGFTRPHAGTALAAFGLALAGWVFLAFGSTEARVRATDTARWLRNAEDGWTHLNAVAIQGAERHARGPGQTVVMVGPSFLQALLPPDSVRTAAFAAVSPGPVRVVELAGPAMSYEETAAVVDKFGSDFAGWFVVSVTRLTLGRDLRTREKAKDAGAMLLGFPSEILTEERKLAGLPVARDWGVPLFDYPGFYLASLGGWRHVLGPPPVFGAAVPMLESPTRPPDIGAIRAAMPEQLPTSLARNLKLLGRVAGRLQAGGGARLAIVEAPTADMAVPEVQTAAWLAARARFVREREAWARVHGVPWIEVAAEITLRPEDFSDLLHIGNPAVRARFMEIVARRLAALQP